MDCELLAKVYVNLIGQKEPTLKFNSDNEIDEKIVLPDNIGNIVSDEETIEVDATFTNEVGVTKSRRVSVIKFKKEEKDSSSSSDQAKK